MRTWRIRLDVPGILAIRVVRPVAAVGLVALVPTSAGGSRPIAAAAEAPPEPVAAETIRVVIQDHAPPGARPTFEVVETDLAGFVVVVSDSAA